jgi:ferritin
MSIKKEMQDAINDQINAEMFSAHLYLSMASWFEDEDLPGFSNWMRCQYMEETMHSMKFFNYLNERGGRAELKAVEGPDISWGSYKEAFEAVVKHEEYISGRINKLVTLARKLEDYATESFLMWYVNEQVEEEDSANEILTLVKRVKQDSNALFMVDNQLAARALSPAAVPTILGQPYPRRKSPELEYKSVITGRPSKGRPYLSLTNRLIIGEELQLKGIEGELTSRLILFRGGLDIRISGFNNAFGLVG